MLQFSFEGFFEVNNGSLDNCFLFFPGDEKQKCEEDENPIKSDDALEPLFMIEDIPKGEQKNEKSKENN